MTEFNLKITNENEIKINLISMYINNTEDWIKRSSLTQKLSFKFVKCIEFL